MVDAASTYFERAGDHAAARSAYIEATAHFRAAIEEADRSPQKDERARSDGRTRPIIERGAFGHRPERAGDHAAARSAYIEATAHFRAAIEEADRSPQKDERARRTLTLLLKLAT
jgi:predicted ATPase